MYSLSEHEGPGGRGKSNSNHNFSVCAETQITYD